jgi:uncharacterized protein with FMN-binding domain
MGKVVLALAATAIGLVLLLSFKSHSAAAPRSALGRTAGDPAPSSSSTTSDPRRRSGSAKSSGSSKKSGTVTGDPISTPFGDMQVAAVISGGKLTNVTVLQETDGGRSQQIDDQALPILKSEALSADSADIDVVSGATYTSQGYARSLQSALDKAHG